MICSAEETIRAEQAAFTAGASASEMMQRAALGVANVIRQFFPKPGNLLVFCGKGNNAGDAIATARYLCSMGWRAELRFAYPVEQLNSLARLEYETFLATPQPPQPLPSSPKVILDGLLGLGATGEPRPPISEAISEIIQLRQSQGYRVVAVDFPTGLDTHSGQPASQCVRADITVAIGTIKTSHISDSATDFVGRIAFVPLPEIEPTPEPDIQASIPQILLSWLPPRNFDTHKGNYGHVGIIAGSPGYFGAAVLCAMGALHAGAGLVTLFQRRDYFPLLSAMCPPEIMVQPQEDYRNILKADLDVLVIGPGLVGENTNEVGEVFRQANIPIILDAGGFEILGGHPKILRLVSGPRILTPHPGEFSRFYRPTAKDRPSIVREFVQQFPCVLLLKGARTVIGAPGRPLFFNTTGSPGMATGGMGDVLAGVIGGLVAQSMRPSQAAILGAWLCGRAAEIALTSGESEQSLIATHIPHYLGQAFHSLYSCEF
ncbi:MAG: NAD(P)H-hydrate dehydratase [Chthoniobacterales bacterium]|nr:NAD(P)H-hydrate dehydratase [Chthoniobacterales bacterium]